MQVSPQIAWPCLVNPSLWLLISCEEHWVKNNFILIITLDTYKIPHNYSVSMYMLHILYIHVRQQHKINM